MCTCIHVFPFSSGLLKTQLWLLSIGKLKAHICSVGRSAQLLLAQHDTVIDANVGWKISHKQHHVKHNSTGAHTAWLIMNVRRKAKLCIAYYLCKLIIDERIFNRFIRYRFKFLVDTTQPGNISQILPRLYRENLLFQKMHENGTNPTTKVSAIPLQKLIYNLSLAQTVNS